ncbi:MAG TPA: hypothetical protein VGG41_09405 [Solirubrobacteraceae bacterium]
MRFAAGGAAAVLIAVVLAGCGGSSQDTGRRQLAGYLAAVDRIERQLASPLSTVDSVDRQLTASSARRRPGTATTGQATGPASSRAVRTPAQQQRALARAHAQITAVTARLRALTAPVPARHLKTLIVTLAVRQAALAVQTERLIAFGPGFTSSLRPLGPAVSKLERVLSVNQAYGAAAVQEVYAQKAAALRRFAATLSTVLASLARLRPPSSSQPTDAAEQRSLTRMRAAALTVAGDLSTGRTTDISGALKQFDRAAKLPASRSAQQAERVAIRAYDRQVGELSSLAADANRERVRLAARER